MPAKAAEHHASWTDMGRTVERLISSLMKTTDRDAQLCVDRGS
jgi:hypothetical protein